MRNDDIENQILKTMNPRQAFYYAKHTIKGRWLEAEPFIMKDPFCAYNYALDIIEGRWPEAEPFILNDLVISCYYSIGVIGGRNLKVEYKLLEKPREYYTELYCSGNMTDYNSLLPLWVKYHTPLDTILEYFQ